MATMKVDVTAAVNRDLSDLCKMQHKELEECKAALSERADWIIGVNQNSAEGMYRKIRKALNHVGDSNNDM